MQTAIAASVGTGLARAPEGGRDRCAAEPAISKGREIGRASEEIERVIGAEYRNAELPRGVCVGRVGSNTMLPLLNEYVKITAFV